MHSRCAGGVCGVGGVKTGALRDYYFLSGQNTAPLETITFERLQTHTPRPTPHTPFPHSTPHTAHPHLTPHTTHCGVWGVGCGTRDVGCGVRGVECGVWGAGCGVLGVGCGVWGVDFGVLKSSSL